MFKKIFWKFIYFCHPYVRDFFLWAKILKHNGRQNYHIGFLNSNHDVNSFKKFLEENGFERDICAWIDDDETLSMRKRVNKIYQHHVRLHLDNEIRGHYEYAPESKPWAHFKGKYFKRDQEYFLSILEKILK